jgi:hypothetical protein
MVLLKTLERRRADIDAIYLNLKTLVDDQEVVIPVSFPKEYVDFIKKRVLELE